MLFNKKDLDTKQRFSIRKLTIGACSVLLSTLFLTVNEGQTVHADTNTSDDTTQQSDKKGGGGQTTTSTPNAPLNLNKKTSNQETSTNENSNNITNNTSTQNTTSQDSEKNQTQSQSESAKIDKTKENYIPTPVTPHADETEEEVVTSSKADQTTKENSAKNQPQNQGDTQTLSLTNKPATQLTANALKESKVATENTTPIVYTIGDGAMANAGSTLTERDAAKFIQNAAQLEAAGAKITWDGTPDTGTAADGVNGGTGSGKIKVTYANGQSTTVDVEFTLNAQVGLQQGHSFYYVGNVGDTVTSLDQPDANGYVLYDSNDSEHSLISPGQSVAGGDPAGVTAHLVSPLDTSTEGIHWADVFVNDTSLTGYNQDMGIETPFLNTVGTYTIKVPYIVKGLKLRTDIPTDADGDPVINAQGQTYANDADSTLLPSNNTQQVGFDPSKGAQTLGQYFYQDYALAYSLGVTTNVSDWTNPADLASAKTNHFTMSLAGLPNSAGQNVQVNYVPLPKLQDLYFYNQGTNPNVPYLSQFSQNNAYLKNDVFKNVEELNKEWPAKTDGYASTSLSHSSNENWLKLKGARTQGQWAITVNASFGQTNASDQPVIFSNLDANGNSISYDGTTGTENFVKQVAQYTTDLFQNVGTGGTTNVAANSPTIYYGLTAIARALYPTTATSPNPIDVSDGPVDTAAAIQANIENSLRHVQANPILDNNTKWPEGTKFEWLNPATNEPETITLDKAGQTYTGTVKITLPTGTSTLVKDVTLSTIANVHVKSETVDYGTVLTAADLVKNKSAFPEGTTFQFTDGEPTWTVPGSYTNVQITATYPLFNATDNKPILDSTGKQETTTTPVATAAVAINDSRVINIVEGSEVPSIDSILNLPSNWEEHTAAWTTDINTNKTNEGLITVHYPSSGLNQEIKVYVNVIPKLTAVDGQEFKTDGSSYSGQGNSIANGENQGGNLTNYDGNSVNYQAYTQTGKDGEQSSFPEKATSYKPTFSLSGLPTNADGSLVSGNQTATIRVSVPAGTLGALTDENGSYYNVQAKVVVAQPVTFEFVDRKTNDIVGDTYTQEFIAGKDTKLDFTMKVPDNYQLVQGASIPTSYTLPSFTGDETVVKVSVKQIMNFTLKFWDDDENKELYSDHLVNPGNGGFDWIKFPAGTFPEGVNAGDYYSVGIDGVPTGATITGSYGVPFTNPDCNWTVPNFKWETTPAVEDALTGATMTIHLKHRTQDVTNSDPQAQETRKVTVNYVKAKVNDDGTYTEDGNAFDSAVLDVYYTRKATKDLVTKNITYGPWQWNTQKTGNGGKAGYNVVSGKWTNLPETWGTVTADVPTLTGYTAYVGGPASNTNKVPANQFVYPTWNTDGEGGQTDPSKASTAYTSAATAYEAQPVHTILYVPNKTEARTITAKFQIVGGDRDGQAFAPDSKIQVFYDKTGTLDPTTNKIVYDNNWQWDTSAGDKANPGFHIISGSWGIPTDGKPSSFNVIPPDPGNDYVIAYMQLNNAYSTQTFATPTYWTNTVFTNNTDPTWYMRNELTTYYVAKPLVEEKITRTINITKPGQSTVTTNQDVTLTRPVRVNANDTGVVFDGFTGSGWTTPNWATNQWPAYTIPTVDGYKPVITQTVDGVTTTIDSIQPQTVNSTTKPTTINVTYTATATATLTGDGSTTYTGNPISIADLNNPTTGLKVTVTGPTANAGSMSLSLGDVEFSTDGTTWTTALPTNADHYQVRLTTQGENAIKSKYGNNSIVWTKDGKSTITSDATFTINPLSGDAVLANRTEGNYTKVYDGAPTSSIDASKFAITTTLNGQPVNLDMTGIDSASYKWVDAQGNSISNPQNVGTYYVKLTNSGFETLKAHNKNFTLTNKGLGVYTITQANASAVLGGSGTRPYNGQAVTVDELNDQGANNNITLTLHYPKDGNADYSTTVKLTADDFVWNTPDGKAPSDANSQAYTISLKPEAIKQIILNAVGSGQNGQANVKFADNAISGTASYTITPLAATANVSNVGDYGKTYDAQVTSQIDPTQLQITTTLGGQTVKLDTTGLTGSDYEWVDASGNPLTEADYPKNVGTYGIKLNAAGIAKLAANNPNYALTVSGTGSYVISQAHGSAELTGSNSKVYNGAVISNAEVNSNGQIVVKLTFPGANNATYTLQDGDYTFSQNNTAVTDPVNVGQYTITLTEAGKAHIAKKVQELSGAGQNDQANAIVDASAISGDASFTITPSENVVNVSGTQAETYTGSPINVVYNADGANSVTVSFANAAGNTTGATASMTNVQLESGDFEIVDASGQPITAENAGGVYHIVLTDAGVAKVQNAVGNNYKISQGTSFGNLVINKAPASAIFSGDPTHVYTGSVNTDLLNGFSVTLHEPNNPTYKLVSGDIEFKVGDTWTTEAPLNVGHYEVRISQAGWDHIKEINKDNVTWNATSSQGEGSYTITPATATTELSGNGSMIYNGSAVTTADLYANDSTIKVAISGTNIANLPTNFTLQDGDYTWNTADSTAPKDVGNYTITLTEQGLNKIQDAINTAVGAGNVNLIRTNTGSAAFEIKQAVAPNVQLHGEEKSEYNGKAVVFDPNNAEIKKNFGFNNTEGLTIPDLTSADFEWVDNDGKPLSEVPVNAGDYYLQLNEAGKKAFASANPNYIFTNKDGASTITGRITYHIYPATLEIGVSGTASKVYNGQNASVTQKQIDDGDIKLVWGNSANEPIGLGSFTLTADDLEVVDAAGQPVKEANFRGGVQTGPNYHVQLTAAAMAKIKALTGANNYDISQATSTANYIIYAHKAQLTLTGNQTTPYGTVLLFDPAAYTAELSNWNDAITPKPIIGKLQAGDVYIQNHQDGTLPTNVGSYKVVISEQLINRLKEEYPDYDFEGTDTNALSENGDTNIVETEHDPASYVITPAVTTVTINGAQHIKYGQDPTIQYGGDNGYTMTITAPVHNNTVNNDKQPIYTNIQLTTGDLEFVTTPDDVGTYEVKLSSQGLKKLHDLTGSTNYDWTQASLARANFFVDQMPVTISVGENKSVEYGSTAWKTAIQNAPEGFSLGIKTENGTTLNYTIQAGDLVFNQTPGNVGFYKVVLSATGLEHIKAALGTNYAYPQVATDVPSHGTLTVTQGEATVELSGTDSTGYTGSSITPNDFKSGKYTYSATIYTADGSAAQTITLTSEDLQFINGDPTNVGHYAVELSDSGKAKLKALDGNHGNNYKWTFNSNATFDVSQVTAKANLSGSNQKVFDGSSVTTAQINDGGDIIVNLNFPASANTTYKLQDGDYTWNTSQGQAPVNAGTYTLKLTQAGLAHLQAAINAKAGEGNVTISVDNLSGQATFMITPKDITNVTINGDDQSKTYDGQDASLNVSGLTISGDGTVADTPLSDTGITASDFDWYDANDNKLDAVPVNAGSYEARLKDSVLKTLQNANPNYHFTAVNGTVKYTINQKSATDTLGDNSEKTYNAQGTTVDSVLDQLTWTPSGLVEGQSLDLSSLTANDYEWYDAEGHVMTGLPTNVGTYYLKIKNGSIDKIKNANPNYSFADGAISGEFTYTINQATGSAALSGQNDKTYDGQAVTTAEINSPSGNIEITFIFPGDNNSSYKLKDGDYDWYDANGTKLTSAPTNAGTYTIKINPEKLQAIINSVAGNGNVKIDGETGSATFTINKKDLNVTLGEKTGVNAGKTYDGQAATLNPADGSFTPSGLVDGESLNTANISADDYEWLDASGNKIDAPTNAGTYYIALKPSGITQLQADNPNYNVTESGKFKYVISPAEAMIKISGSQESTNAEIDPANYHVTGATGVTIPEGLTYEFVGNPDQAGTYVISLTPDSIQKLKAANPNYALKISSTAEFTLDATLTITFEDTTEGNKQVGKAITKIGAYDSTIADLGLKVPDNYELAQGQDLPTTYTFGKDLQQNLNIKLVHKTVPVDPTKPDTNPDPKDKDWFKQNGLVKDITRKINYSGLTQAQLDKIPADQKEPQTVEFTRTATYDLVTGKLVANSEGKWTALDGKSTWAGFTPKEFAGYTANKTVPPVNVQATDSDSSITITYTANEQAVTIKFVDDDNNESQVGETITKTGVTDQTIDNLDLKVPDHYELADGQTLPTSYKFTAAKDQTITIHLTEKKVTVDPTKPDTNPDPKDKDWFKQNGLVKDITRTINYSGLSQDQLAQIPADQKNPQTVEFTRTATYNLVTGKLVAGSEGEWTALDGKNTWAAFTPKEFAGYTADKTVPEVTVQATDSNSTITITYTPNDQSGKISYVDGDGKEISNTPISGKTGESVKITPEVPAGWEIVPGQDIPEAVTATADGVPTVTIKIRHKTIKVTPDTPKDQIPTGKVPGNPNRNYPAMKDLVKTPTRTITVIKPDGTKQTLPPQVVKFTRTATFDEVTGEVTYSDWKLASSSDGWDAYTPETIPGYTAHITQTVDGKTTTITSIGKVDVTADTGNVTVEIKYTPNAQPPIPQTAQQIVKFVDSDGNVVDSKTYTGEYGSKVSVDLKLPEGYKLADGEKLPTTITIENGVTIIKIVKDSGGTQPDDKPDDHPHTKPDDNNKPNNKPTTPNKPHTNGKGQVVTPDGKVFPKGSHIATNGDVIGPNGRILYHAGKLTRIGERVVKKTLPQTGAVSDNPFVAGLAILGAGLGLFGLADRRKKKKEDK